MFAELIRQVRGKASQRTFAKFLGVHHTTLSKWERGLRQPPESIKMTVLSIRDIQREKRG